MSVLGSMLRLGMARTAAVLSVGFVLAAPVAVSAESLSDALASAYKNSGLLEQNRALLRASDEGVAQATSALRPVVNYALSSNYSSITEQLSSSLEISTSMVLYDFGSSKLGVEAAKESVLGMRASLLGVEQSVLARAVSAYMGVREAEAIVGLRDSNVRVITQELRASNDRFAVGEVTRTDVAIAEARLAAATASYAAANGQLAMAREEYKAAVGHYPGALSNPPSVPATAHSLDDAKAVARKRHPDMTAAQHDVNVAELNIKRAENAMKPRLMGTGAVSVDNNGNDSSRVGLSLSGTIYQGGNLSSLMRAAKARRDASRAGVLMAAQRVEQGVGNAWAQLATTNASQQASEQQVRAARVAFEGVREEKELGARTMLDLLNAEQELLDAQAGAISAQTNRYVAVYNLLSAMGLLNVKHLGLAVTSYDVNAYYDAVKNAPVHNVSPQGEKLDNVLKALGKF